MNRPETQNQPSVDELLLSIRQAIHGEGAVNSDTAGVLGQKMAGSTPKRSAVKSKGPTVSASMSQTRVSLQPQRKNQTSGRADRHTENFFKLRNQLQEMGAKSPHDRPAVVAAGSRSGGANGFAGILNGDTRLEDALAKLKRAGLGDGDDSDYVENQVEHSPELRSYSAEAPEAEFSEYEEVYEGQEFDDVHQYTPEIEPVENVDDSFSVLTRQKYLEPVQPQSSPEEVISVPFHQEAETRLEVLAEVPAEVMYSGQAPASHPLTSDQSAAETSAAFNRLADTIVGNATSGERSIDGITRDLLRPMLQSWLDEHLPRVVERLVREEIERVARWGGK